jgi:hypothetical protein
VGLVEKLESTEEQAPNEVQAGLLENGPSAAIILLSMTVIESVLGRMQYVRSDGLPDRREHLIEYLLRIAPAVANDAIPEERIRELAADVEECFAVRDAIAHGHLWEASVLWDCDGVLKFAQAPRLLDGFGDRRMRRVLDPATRSTRRSQLNLFSSRIWRKDAWKVLRVADTVFSTVELLDRRYFYLSPQTFTYANRPLSFTEVVARLKDPS